MNVLHLLFGTLRYRNDYRRSYTPVQTGPNPAKVAEAREFLSTALRSLADQHAQALAKLNFSEDDLKKKSKELEKRLLQGRALMLQQADVRWSKSITDQALKELDIDASDLRCDIRVRL